MSRPFLTEWRKALQEKRFRRKCYVTLFYIVVLILLLNPFFEYIQHRQGITLNDPLLDRIPASDISAYLFPLLYLSILTALLFLLSHPHRLLRLIIAAAIMYTLRIVTLWLIPLDPPESCIPLSDPLVQHLAYHDNVITKDLFFSGHTSIVLLLIFSASQKALKWLFSCCLCAVIILLLVQHIHYTIDILGAFFFTWISWWLSGLIISPNVHDWAA